MILTHGANSLAMGGGDFVEIGGRRYPVVKIGSQWWLAENLDHAWDGLVIGSSTSSSARANYFDNNETLYGRTGRKCGLLYNYAAVTELASQIPSGWRVPTSSDINSLKTATQDAQNAAYLLSNSDISWAASVWSGENMFEFNLIPSGQRFDGGTFYGNGLESVFWLNDRYAAYRSYRSAAATLDSYFSELYVSNNAQLSVRLVKDAT